MDFVFSDYMSYIISESFQLSRWLFESVVLVRAVYLNNWTRSRRYQVGCGRIERDRDTESTDLRYLH